jgi:hypothetical protein
MADFYAEMAQVAASLLAPTSDGGLGQGTVTLSRSVRVDPVNSWDEPTFTWATQTLRASVRGVSAKMVGLPAGEPENGVIVASDRVATCAVPAAGYSVGDLMAIDGRPVTVLQFENIPAAGTPSAVRFVVRG